MPSPTWASAAASAAVAEGVRGFHLFQIVGYSHAKDMPTGTPLRSCLFTIGGYRWAVEVFTNGHIPEAADFISVSCARMEDVASSP
ncbi:BTB/POZ domain containing protein [Hordeum vulgare]|nr:BTB/POZ domain containing protein [Hordeum vulgare]